VVTEPQRGSTCEISSTILPSGKTKSSNHQARAGAALAMMSASGSTPPEAAKGEVLADVVDCLALVEEFRTAAGRI